MRVTWVHPSWRDLVIEALVRDPDERRRFLSHCGPDGAALALSSAGGAWGRRTRPLLRGDGDWDALGDRLHRLCPELDEPDAVGLVNALAELEQEDEAMALAELVLARLGWAGHAVAVDALYAWAAVAERFDLPVDPTSVSKTWFALEPSDVPATPAELERFADWLRLAELLADHDYSLLASFGFPDGHETLLRAFADQLPPDEPVLERERRLESLARIAILEPGLTSRVMTATISLGFEAEPRATQLESVSEAAPATGFPIERVLSDL